MLSSRTDLGRWLNPARPADITFEFSRLKCSDGMLEESGQLVLPHDIKNGHLLVSGSNHIHQRMGFLLPQLYSECMSLDSSSVMFGLSKRDAFPLRTFVQNNNPGKKVVIFDPTGQDATENWNLLSKLGTASDANLTA